MARILTRVVIRGVLPLRNGSGFPRAKRFLSLIDLINLRLQTRYALGSPKSGLLIHKRYEELAKKSLPDFEVGHWHFDEKGSNRYFNEGVSILHLAGIPQRNLAIMEAELKLSKKQTLTKGVTSYKGQKLSIDPSLQKFIAAERDDHYLQAEGRLRAHRRAGERLFVIYYDPYAEKFADEIIDIADLLSETELEELRMTVKSRYSTQLESFEVSRKERIEAADARDSSLRFKAIRLAGLGFRHFTYDWFEVSERKCQNLKLRDIFLQTQRLYVSTDEDVTTVKCSPTSEDATFFYNVLLKADRALHRNPVFRLYGNLQKDEFESLFGLNPGSVKGKVRKIDLKPYLTLDYTARLTGLSEEPDEDGIVPAKYAAIPIPSVSVGSVLYINNYLQGKQILAELEQSITDKPDSRMFLIWVQPLEDLADEAHDPDNRVRYLLLQHPSTGKTYFIDLFRILTAGKSDIIQQLQKIFDKALVVGYDLQQSGVLLKAQQNLTISNPYCLKVALNYLSRATGKSFKYMEKDFLGKLPRAVYSDWKTPRTTISDRESLVACCKYQEQLFRDIVKRFRENSLISRGDTLISKLELGDSYFELEMSLLPALVEASSAGIKVDKEELERLLVQQTALDSTEGRSTLVGILQSCEASKPMLHAYFKQIASITGRLSSVNPNIMGIDREFHRFVLSRSGHVLLSADYSQIEPRIAASYAGEEALLQVFREGKDIYIEIASSLFQIAPDSVDTETRSKIKTMFLGLLYGMGAKALQKRLLDRGIDVTISEAKELIINFKNAYPKLGGLIDESGKLAAEQKKAGGMITVRTMIGRPITIDSAVAEESELRAHNFNHIIQGTGADILKLAAVEFHKRIREEGLRAQIVNLVHDEILVEVFREDRDRVREVLVNVMEMVGREVIGVDTPVECGVGSNWRIAKEKQL